MSRPCAICGTQLNPFTPDTLTAHEFNCYRAHPDKIPSYHREQFDHELAGFRRSQAAFRGVNTRYARQGKRAPRRPVRVPQ